MASTSSTDLRVDDLAGGGLLGRPSFTSFNYLQTSTILGRLVKLFCRQSKMIGRNTSNSASLSLLKYSSLI